MHYASILREIDAELDRLCRARKILEGMAVSASIVQRPVLKKRPAKRSVAATPTPTEPNKGKTVSPGSGLTMTSSVTASIPQPTVTILPPKQKREYRRTIKASVPEPRALAAPRSNEVIVYMPPGVPTKSVAKAATSQQVPLDHLEAVMRQRFFSGKEADYTEGQRDGSTFSLALELSDTGTRSLPFAIGTT